MAIPVGTSRSAMSMELGVVAGGRTKNAWKTIETNWQKKIPPAAIRLFLMRWRLTY